MELVICLPPPLPHDHFCYSNHNDTLMKLLSEILSQEKGDNYHQNKQDTLFQLNPCLILTLNKQDLLWNLNPCLTFTLNKQDTLWILSPCIILTLNK